MPGAAVRLVRLAGQADVDLAAAKTFVKIGHVEADRGVVTPGFISKVDALSGRVPGLPEAEPGEIVEEVADHPAGPVQHAGDAVGLDQAGQL